MTTEQLAESIARKAHAGQTEVLTGDPYIGHVERVVAMVDNDDSSSSDAKAVAWLHDVLEDTELGSIDLLEFGVPERVVDAVVTLTRLAALETYAQYVMRVKFSGDDLAIVVKLADLRDHLRPTCPARLRRRYETAIALFADQT